MPDRKSVPQKSPVKSTSLASAQTRRVDAAETFAVDYRNQITPANVLQLQRLLGNRATGSLVNAITHAAPSGAIQRNPEEIAKIEAQIREREERHSELKGKPRQRNNAQIKKLQDQLEALRSAASATTSTPEATATPETPEATATPETPATPEAPKEPTYAERYPQLAASFNEDEIKAFVDTLGDGAAKGLMALFTVAELKEMFDAFGAAGIGELPGQFGQSIAVQLIKNLTAAKVKDLMSAYPVAEIKAMLTSLGIDVLKDLMNTFTGSEFKNYTTVMGATRLTDLMKNKKLKASALKKYGATWLKTFVGANATTMNHLLGIDQRMDTGTISGGHDSTVFRPFLAEIIGSYTEEDEDGNEQTYDVKRGRITYSNPTATYEKVGYKTHTTDGYDWATGSKTLIKNLQASQAAWLTKANEAIWNSIAAETFDPDTSAWAGTSADGTAFNGFYTKPRIAVDTFFPV